MCALHTIVQALTLQVTPQERILSGILKPRCNRRRRLIEIRRNRTPLLSYPTKNERLYKVVVDVGVYFYLSAEVNYIRKGKHHHKGEILTKVRTHCTLGYTMRYRIVTTLKNHCHHIKTFHTVPKGMRKSGKKKKSLNRDSTNQRATASQQNKKKQSSKRR